jgi:putative ABC transport system substrate-binding protein
MKRRTLLRSALAMAALPRAYAQNAPKVARIGWLTAQRAPSLTPYVDALRKALAELGYIEDRNLVIELRFADDAIDRIPELATDLEGIPVDLILAQDAAVPVISQLDLKVPVVYVFSGDPVVAGAADSLVGPRGNMSEWTIMAAEVSAKRIELLREIMPKVRNVAIVANPEHPGAHVERAYTEQAGQRSGLTISYFPTRTREELAGTLTVMARRPPQAISLLADGFAIDNREEIIAFAASYRAPVVSGWPVFARSGALCTYGPRLFDSYRQLAHYADRIIKGTHPATLPIERPTTFELVINLRTARALDLIVPPSLLVRADEVIE